MLSHGGHYSYLNRISCSQNSCCVAGLPSDMKEEDGTRQSYQLAFGSMDHDESKTIECA
jgi:hypothetical protein